MQIPRNHTLDYDIDQSSIDKVFQDYVDICPIGDKPPTDHCDATVIQIHQKGEATKQTKNQQQNHKFNDTTDVERECEIIDRNRLRHRHVRCRT